MNPRALDFSRAGGTPATGWVLLAVGIAAVAVATWFNARWDAERAEINRLEQMRLAGVAASTALQERLNTPPALPSRTQNALVELNRPWLASLRAVESATRDPIFVLAMMVDARTGAIKLDAEADDFNQAVGYVEKLSASPALHAASLMSHEATAAGAATGKGLRFSVDARWVTP